MYIELLDDPKMGQLPDWLWRRAIELFLLAGENGNDGLLPPVTQMAWRLRLDETKLSESLRALSEVGVVHETPQGWVVTNFRKRQFSESFERTRQWRERHRDESGDAAVTDISSSSPSLSGSESLERGGPGEETAAAVADWNNNSERDCLNLYTMVTGQMAIPYDQTTQALHDLDTLLFGYYGGKTEQAIQDGKRIFSRWCQTRGKSGKKYSPTNTGWLTWWLAEKAPRPAEEAGKTALSKALEALNG